MKKTNLSKGLGLLCKCARVSTVCWVGRNESQGSARGRTKRGDEFRRELGGGAAAVRLRCGYGRATVRRRCGNNLVFTLITQVKLYRFSKPPFCNAILAFARMLANLPIELGGT